MLRTLFDVFGFLRFVLRRWSEDRCPQIAGSLTFTTLLAIVPVFAIVVVILSSLPIFEEVMIRLKIFLLLNLVPEIAGKIITVYMGQFADAAGKLTLLSLGALLVTALAMLSTVDSSLNAIWRVRRMRPLWLSLIAYLFLLLIGPLLIGISVTATTYLYTLSTGLERLPDEAQPVLLHVVPVLMSATMFILVYRVVPYRHVPWLHAILGGALAAVLFEAMKALFAAYIRSVPGANVVYGTFAAIPVFLLWMYLSWLVVLFGAEFTACAGYWRHRLWKRAPTPGRRFRDALKVGRLLAEAKGEPLSFETLRVECAVPAEELEDTLTHLEKRGIIRRQGARNYTLDKAPEAVTLGDFWAAAVADGEGLDPREWSSISPDFIDVAQTFEAQMKRPLAELYREDEPSGR
ncbi:YihY family inner membrane protein [Usitatibacter palustris]|uniref:YihY family inner membrane protein n=1 Tax=Usitatibacter palustris TaxID=2732487 RepID=UPI001BB13593|nr:YihY family inner membrane protein [Usitatibacter palustris]